MIFLGDYFAIGLVIILSMFYLDRKTNVHYRTIAGTFYFTSLVLTASTAIVDIISGELLLLQDVPNWLNVLANTLYFLVNIVTTSFFALYLFTKILEHSHHSICMRNAKRGLGTLFTLYLILVICNLWTGWLFYFDGNGNYCRGPLNIAGYVTTVLQMALVTICYFRNRKIASRPMRRALLMTFPVIILCIVIQRTFPEIMLNGFIMSMVALVLFLSFQGQRQGVHSLTELNDRRRFFKEIERRIKHKELFQVFLINIKNYGSVNQKYGHIFGDELLYQFAFSLEKLIKDSEAFHMNGTVFSLILPYTDQTLAEQHSGTLLDFLSRKIDFQNRQISLDYVMVEYSAAELESSASDLYEKLEYAAANAYKNKHRYIRYTPDMGTKMTRDRYLLDRLQTIDRAHGYEVWYQPIKCLGSQKFGSMEALVRLREPDGSLVSPAEFIPLAEQTGRITSITWFVLEEVCKLLKNTEALQDVCVSVNMPMPQLLEKGFVSRLNGIVDRYGVSHRRIYLEFTERAILENFESTKDIMIDLTEDGYRFYLDDFGSGYSNFNCLLQLPFQIIKLDSCLIKSALEGKIDYSMIGTLTHVFHDMNLNVIAEGIETPAEVEKLAEQGVDRIQGYVFAKPMPVKDLLTFYQEHPMTPTNS